MGLIYITTLCSQITAIGLFLLRPTDHLESGKHVIKALVDFQFISVESGFIAAVVMTSAFMFKKWFSLIKLFPTLAIATISGILIACLNSIFLGIFKKPLESLHHTFETIFICPVFIIGVNFLVVLRFKHFFSF